jgi:predicted ATPase/DNA-binding SARP family transcriptional activator
MNAQHDAQQASAAGLGHVEFRLLGPLEALVEGEPVPLGAPKQRALLAQLLLRANEAVPVERLVDALWPEAPPASARHAVQVYVSRLRRALGPDRIEARSRAYLLRAGPEEVDHARFRRLVAEARKALAGGDAYGAAERLRAALALWRGRALADLDGEPGVAELVLELEEERSAAIELRFESELEAGRDAELVPELERLVAEHPARERLHAGLMLALHRAGRQEEALQAYDRARQALLNELGLDPSLSLQELAAAIRRSDSALTPLSPELRARLHLPAQPNQFIGRERELDDLVELITVRALRLVTLTGAGGIGKTRLALAAAEQLVAHFEDGVWFVDLSPLSDPSHVVPAIAQALGVTESAEQPLETALQAHVADKHMLLVTDNFEQVMDAAPSLSRLVQSSPRLAILATSRSPLRVLDEQEYIVPPLAVPDPSRRDDLSSLEEFEAVRLLVARARAVVRRFEVTEANGRQIAAICAAVDGLPLAIELAGATLKAFSLSELRERLEASLDSLVAGPIDAPTRQRTVRATIEWSHNLLGPAEQKLFARLAVFSGGWSAEAAHEVCGATRQLLSSLREKGLIHSDGERFSTLTPIREFALARLEPDVARAMAGKHAAYFAGLGASAQERAHVPGRDTEYLDTFARDYENFRAAVHATRDTGDADRFARLAAALGEYCYVRGPYAEVREWLEVAFADPPEDARLHALVARSLGSVSGEQGDHHRSFAAHERAAALFRSIGDRDMEARSLVNWGVEAINLGDHGRARELLTEGRERAGGLVDGRRRLLIEQLVLNELGYLEYLEGRRAEAEGWFEESLAICERIDDAEGAANALLNLGLVALGSDRLRDAAARFRKALRLADELQRPQTTADCILGLAAVLVRDGDPSRSGVLLGAADAMFEDAGVELSPIERTIRHDAVAGIQGRIGEDAAAKALAMGRSLSRGDALAHAWSDGD